MTSQLQRFVSFAFAAADLLIEVGDEGEIIFAMGAATGLTDRCDEAWLGRFWLELFHVDDRLLVQTAAGSLAVGNRGGPMLVRMADGERGNPVRRALLNTCRLPGTRNRLSCVLSAATPAQDHIATFKTRDPETQLLDRDAFATSARDMATAASELTHEVGLTLLDIPELTGLATDQPALCSDLVRRIGALLRSASVGGDAVGRLAPTRFGIVHDGDATELGHRLQDVAAEGTRAGVRLTLKGRRLELAAPELGREELLQAVRFTVNRFAADPGSAMPGSLSLAFEQMVGETLQQMGEFTAAVDTNQFDLAFQPIVDLATGVLAHFEVLSRFSDDASPFEKIRFAEEIGIIERFDMAVCTRALSTLRTPSAESPKAFKLAVNVSGRSIENPLFMRLLLALLDNNRDLASRLSIEITESVQLADLARADKLIQEIRRRGFAVCLDDFGAGGASFQYLQALTVDGVKIDGAYIQRLGGTPRDDILLRGLVRLCNDLKTAVTAEMIETKAQAELLRNLGVRYGQGWLFGKPGPTPYWPLAASPPAQAAGQRRVRRQGITESWG
jgi:EAL domain-containing protein (putative c-di-GMP-specific phosphodiesterase class I)/GGDEF domain-containing protein